MIEIMDIARVRECVFALEYRRELARSLDGRLWSRAMGPPVWTCAYTTPPMPNADAGRLEARLQRCLTDGEVFEGYDHRRIGPASNPNPGLAGVTIGGIATGNRKLRLDGLPAGFVLSDGDYIAWDHPVGRVLHRIAEDIAADGTGSTDLIDISPAIIPGAVAGATVRLKKAAALFTVTSLDVTQEGMLHSRVSWTGVQVFG